MAALPLSVLLGLQFLCARGQLQSAGVELLTEAATAWQGPLPCGEWDCDCAFRKQPGCCCAADGMFTLEEDSFHRIEYLMRDVMSLGKKVQELTGHSRIAFEANMAPGGQCFGPFSTNVPIPYSNVTLNDANGYNPSLGVFTAPCAGVYVFSFTVHSCVLENESLYHKVQLMRNGVVEASVWENNREDFEDNANHVVVLKLQRGDQVYIELMSGRRLCTQQPFNIFTGYILYPDTGDSTY
ncbi:cerebellin 18 isoform 1-T2 [Spinachia spinachia]